MSHPVKITIIGSGETGTDAPSADDFLGQVSDFLEVLKGVEKAIDEDGETQLVWRVTNAQMNSPLLVELTPFAKNPAVFVGDRAEAVETATANGIAAMERGDFKPKYFSDETAKRAKAIHTRVTNGLANTTFRFDNKVSANPVTINRDSAARFAAALEAVPRHVPIPYREIGSVEGFVTRVEQDGHGRAILRFKDRLHGDEVKAVASGKAFQQVGTMRLSDVWEGARIRVFGTISYRDLGKIDGMQATGIELLDQGPLPTVEEILDADFTGGLTAEQFLNAVRND